MGQVVAGRHADRRQQRRDQPAGAQVVLEQRPPGDHHA
jgi:hypothetical protein